MTVVLLLGIVIVGFVCIRLYAKYHKTLLIRFLESDFQNVKEFDFTEDEYDRMKNYYRYDPPHLGVDDITWSDLNMDALYKRMHFTASTFGDQTLYRRLRSQNLEDRERFEDNVEFFSNDDAMRLQVLWNHYAMGRPRSGDLRGFLTGKEPSKTLFLPFFIGLALVPIISIFLVIFVDVSAVLLLTVSIIINMGIYYSIVQKYRNEFTHMEQMNSLYRCMKADARVFEHYDYPDSEKFYQCHKSIRSVGFLSALVALGVTDGPKSEFNFMMDLLSGVFLIPFIAYGLLMRKHIENASQYLDAMDVLGNIEVEMSVGIFRKTLECVSKPQLTKEDRVSFTDLYHPLIENPVSLSKILNLNNLITGSNASGKSTFVKALALSTLCGLSINTVFASEMQFKPRFVMTSMALRDDIIAGDSYFVAELKSIHRILEMSKSRETFIIIDEILKGTNTIERIASSLAVLESFNEQGCFVLAATHDIEITEVLADSYDNYHFKETIIDKDILFDYQLYDGPSTTRNAIRLLEYYHFDEKIIENANKRADAFTQNRIW